MLTRKLAPEDKSREAVDGYLNGGRWTLVSEIVEIESGKRSDRPELAKALSLCRLPGNNEYVGASVYSVASAQRSCGEAMLIQEDTRKQDAGSPGGQAIEEQVIGLLARGIQLRPTNAQTSPPLYSTNSHWAQFQVLVSATRAWSVPAANEVFAWKVIREPAAARLRGKE